MTTPGRAEAVLDEQILDELMSRATSRWGGNLRPCRWITGPSETTLHAAGIRTPEAKEAREADSGAGEAAVQPSAAPVTESSEGQGSTDERRDETPGHEAEKPTQATQAKAPRPARPPRAKKAEAPRSARARGTKKR
jgi:hypothetical protein